MQEQKDVTLTLDAESNFARWMGQNVVVDQLKGKKELLPMACYGTDGKPRPFPKLYGVPLGASADGSILLVGAFSSDLAQQVDFSQAVERAKTDGALMHLVSGAGKILQSCKVTDFNLQAVSPAGKCFTCLEFVEDKNHPLGRTGVVRVLTPEGKVLNEVKGMQALIGLLDDGRLITHGVSPDGAGRAVTIHEQSKPAVLVNTAGSAIVQGNRVYYISDSDCGSIRCVEIPQAHPRSGGPPGEKR